MVSPVLNPRRIFLAYWHLTHPPRIFEDQTQNPIRSTAVGGVTDAELALTVGYPAPHGAVGSGRAVARITGADRCPVVFPTSPGTGAPTFRLIAAYV